MNMYDSTTQSSSKGYSFSSFMSSVYAWMGGALMLTAVAAYGVYNSVPLFNFILQKYVFMSLLLVNIFLPTALIVFIEKISFKSALALYVAYSLLNGVTLSVIFAAFELPSIVTILLVTVTMFVAMALYGYCTKADLTGIGNVLIMGLFGIVIAGLINLFFHNGMVDFICSALGVIIFTGLIAYDTQKLKDLGARYLELGQPLGKIALVGALTLYLDFVNLFLNLLTLFGKKKK
jgi:uncharacterized protein